IINCARGGLIDEEALAKAVREKRVAGAAIDVFSTEPATKSILFEEDNIMFGLSLTLRLSTRYAIA
ncbi:unnamed protein product, partial [marine sediment metagenome]